jgi:DNA-binding MarR family transcriptional regulator
VREQSAGQTDVHDVDQVAGALRAAIGALVRRLRQVQVAGELTLSESSALARLDRGGPTTSSALAKLEQISPQSMGATLAALEARGLVARSPDPADGRRILLSVTAAGQQTVWSNRAAKTERLAQALATGFTRAEVDRLAAAVPLLERLAERI